MQTWAARVISNGIAIIIIAIGIIHLGIVFYVVPSLLSGRVMLDYILPAFVFPSLIAAGGGIVFGQQWAYYLAYIAIVCDL
jgi:hypothetical protein